jgi:hypothetical protein
VATASAQEAHAPHPEEPHQGPGVIRAEAQRMTVRDLEGDTADWRPGRVVRIVVILAVLFILIITLLISRGQGAAH